MFPSEIQPSRLPSLRSDGDMPDVCTTAAPTSIETVHLLHLTTAIYVAPAALRAGHSKILLSTIFALLNAFYNRCQSPLPCPTTSNREYAVSFGTCALGSETAPDCESAEVRKPIDPIWVGYAHWPSKCNPFLYLSTRSWILRAYSQSATPCIWHNNLSDDLLKLAYSQMRNPTKSSLSDDSHHTDTFADAEITRPVVGDGMPPVPSQQVSRGRRPGCFLSIGRPAGHILREVKKIHKQPH